jgi:hypothetical protein
MSGLVEITGPAIEPISRIEAREHLRLDDDVDDSQIRAYIIAARQWAENYTGRVFITRTLRMFLDGFANVTGEPYWEGTRVAPQIRTYSSYIEIAASPVIAVSSVKYYDDADNESTWATSNYYVDTAGDIAKIVLRDGGTFPTDLRSANGLEINFTAGYGSSPNSVPEAIRIAMLQYMTFLYEHRGDFERFPPPQPPAVLKTLLNPYKIMRFGTTPYQKMLKTGIG